MAMRLLLALRVIEDLRDETELSGDAFDGPLIAELNECLEVLRQYAGDTTEKGLPKYVAFLWGDPKQKMGRYTKPALRKYKAEQLAQQEKKHSAFKHHYIVSSETELQELQKRATDSSLDAVVQYYFEWCRRFNEQPFRYLKG